MNLNPLMRFDGYYFLSDAVDIPNLQSRSFAIARWSVRRFLFGAYADSPENLSSRTRRWLTAYAIATWIYRFFLFLGIALLVYHMAFKALGVLLFAIEIWHFILRPIVAELSQCRTGIMRSIRSWRGPFYLGAAILAGAWLIVPHPRTLSFPATIRAVEETELLAPSVGRISAVHVADGDRVAIGDPLMTLQSTELAHQIERTRIEQDTVTRLLEQTAYDSADAGRAILLRDELRTTTAERNLLRVQDSALKMRSETDGNVRDLPSHIVPGQLVAQGERLGWIATTESRLVVYVPFAERRTIDEGAPLIVFLHGDPTTSFTARWDRIESVPLAVLDDQVLASTHGGPIDSSRDVNGELQPRQSLFRATAVFDAAPPNAGGSIVTVLTKSIPVRRAERFANLLTNLIVRESGL